MSISNNTNLESILNDYSEEFPFISLRTLVALKKILKSFKSSTKIDENYLQFLDLPGIPDDVPPLAKEDESLRRIVNVFLSEYPSLSNYVLENFKSILPLEVRDIFLLMSSLPYILHLSLIIQDISGEDEKTLVNLQFLTQKIIKSYEIQRDNIKIFPLKKLNAMYTRFSEWLAQNIALVLFTKGLYTFSEILLVFLLELGKSMKNDELKAWTHFYLGGIYLNNNLFDAAEDHYKKSLNYVKAFLKKNEVKEIPKLAKIYYNLGIIKSEKKDFNNAIYYMKEALDAYQKMESVYHKNVNVEKINTLFRLGTIYLARNELNKAEKYYREAMIVYAKLTKNEKQNILPIMGQLRLNLGIINLDRGLISEARKNLIESKRIWKKLERENKKLFSIMRPYYVTTQKYLRAIKRKM
ncbi:MAG: tetratricopeptide repeat protein [Candidatus Asgardarchaeia archaeon]